MASSIIIRNGTIVTANAIASVVRGSDILVEDNRIVSIAPNIQVEGAEVIDASDAIVMPGLIDTHIHMWQHPLREIGARLWGHTIYKNVVSSKREFFDPSDIHSAILACGLEMLDHGVTGALDFFHSILSSEHASAALEAHHTTGQRSVLAYGMSMGYTFPDQKIHERPWQERLDDFGRLRAEAQASPNELVKVGLGLSEVNDNSFFDEIAFARSLEARMTFHQNGPGEVTLLQSQGALGPDLVAVHANAVTDQELDWLAQSGTPLSSTPECEASVGRPLTVIPRALKRGVPFSVGTDTTARAPINMFAQMKLVYTIMQYLDAQGLRDSARIPLNTAIDPMSGSMDDILRAGTAGGAYALGYGDDLGTIAVGSLADIIVVRPSRDAAAALADPVAHLMVTVPTARDVDTVMVNGVIRKSGGQLVVDFDLEEFTAQNQIVRENVLSRAAQN